MASLDIDVLVPLAAQLIGDVHLTPAERAEVLRVAQGFACKDSAVAANVSPETIRARRKRLYRKLGIHGAGELVASLLALSLQTLGAEGVQSASARAGDASRPAARPSR